MGEDFIKKIIEIIGENPERDGLKHTPSRVIEGYKNLFSGYGKNYHDIIGSSFIKGETNDIILFSKIDFLSSCEHHMLPFYGKINIAYIPGENLISLGRISSLISAVTRRLQIQERITSELGNSLQESSLSPNGVFISIEGKHLCTCVSETSVPSTLRSVYTTKDFKLKENLFKLSLLMKEAL